MWKKVYDENGYYPVYTTEENLSAEDLWNYAEEVVNSQKKTTGKKKTPKKKKESS